MFARKSHGEWVYLVQMKALGLAAMLLMLATGAARAQDDGGVSYDSHGQELLESLDVPPVKNAPFSLMLSTEWSRPMSNGGTFTIVNTRPMKRDAAGRIYQERWLLSPKGSRVKSEMSWLQIADPVERTLTECQVRTRICYLEDWRGWNDAAAQPELAVSGPLKSGQGTHLHEDLGADSVAGVAVHGYRETITLKAGVLGNDKPLVTVREFRFAPSLAMDMTSLVETPRLGRQVFTVTEISTTEPDAKWFQPPAGYRMVEKRRAFAGVN